MNPGVRRYLQKKADLQRWPLDVASTQGVRLVVVIPALAEFPGLLHTLDSVAAASPGACAQTLIIVVVNHRENASAAERENNRQTLDVLRTRSGPLRVGIVDAASPGRELLSKEGVGTARKAGLDWGLSVLAENGRESGGLVCLDADTPVGTGYLDTLHPFFSTPGRWAAVIEYAHPLDGQTAETAAILYYEIYLRYYELGLAFAGSPYAYPAIGSAMGCTGIAYAAVSGMNRRCAGEDFYFLQQLAKTGPIHRVSPIAMVYPASRPSQRVPFGTGRSVIEFQEDSEAACRLYHPESFRLLKGWLETVESHLEWSGEKLLEAAADLHPELAEFLSSQDFADTWTRLNKTHGGTIRMAPAFHTWFDAFRTLKWMHHLRDHGFPEQTGFLAVGELLSWMGENSITPPASEDLDAQRQLLERLRALCRMQGARGIRS